MGKKLISLFLFVLLISLVGATTYKRGEEINIRHSIRFSDSPTSTASCNITVYNPVWNILVSFEPMRYDSSSETYNYTLHQSNVSEVGAYCYDITCSQVGKNKTSQFCFDVTVTGEEFTTPQSVLYFLLLLVLIGFFTFTLYFSFSIPWINERNNLNEVININYRKYLKLFCVTMSYIFLLWITYIGWNLSYGFLNLNFLGNFFHAMFIMFIALTFPIFVSIIVIGTVAFLRDKNIKNYIDRGVFQI